MKELLQKYADLKVKEKEIAAQIAELAPAILAEIENQGADKIETVFGKFVREVRKTWKYSNTVTRLEDHLTLKKSEEKADGTATFEEKSFLKFFEPKEEK